MDKLQYMDTPLVQKIASVLEKNQNISIVVGKNPNLDVMASALSLYLALEQQNKKVTIASPSEPIVELSSLVGIDRVTTQLGSASGDLVVSFPYKTNQEQEGEIKKVSYTLADGYLNIVVKASGQGLSFSEQDVKFQTGSTFTEVLFVIGTPRVSDLGNLFDPEGLKNTTMVNIDNKQENQGFGDIVYVSPKYSSVSEQMAQLLTELRMQIDIDIAQNLLDGISFATNNFQKPDTSVMAFEMAGLLMKKGANRDKAVSRSDFDFPVKMPPIQQGSQQRPASLREDFDQFDNTRSPSAVLRAGKQPMPKKDNRAFFTQDRKDTSGGRQDQSLTYAPPKARSEDLIEKGDKSTPSDWLAPKIYKGSTEV